MKRALVGAAILLAGCAGAVWIEPRGNSVLVVAPLPPELREGPLPAATAERFLRFCRVDPETGAEGPPMLGVYGREGGRLTFTPRHGPAPGERYRAVAGSNRVEHVVASAAASERAVVSAVYPSAHPVPANLLKFYIHFSRPMREGRYIFDHLRLLREDGTAVAEPWRRLDLWTPEATRLTLWIHPGRVKRGVNLREEEGPVLVPGRSYTLEIGPEVLDADGRPLGRPFAHRFTATEEDHGKPSPADWTIEPPRAGTRDPLVVRFPEPLDRALTLRGLTVADLPGAGEVAPGERVWSFTPELDWTARDHRIRVSPLLEDLAGNTPVRRFEEEVGAPAEPAPLALPFRPR